MNNLSLIFPVHNEEKYLEKSINFLISELKTEKAYDWEIILVENGSRDKSWEICKQLSQIHSPHIKCYKIKKASYGLSLFKGIQQAKKENIFLFNIDFWDVDFIKKSLFLKGSDVVVGSKTLINSQDLRPFYRRITTYFFNVLLRLVYNFPGTDTHGIKKLKRSTVQSIALGCYPLHELYDTQIVLRSCKKNLVYTELPITVRESRPTRYYFFKRLFNLTHDLVIIFQYRYL